MFTVVHDFKRMVNADSVSVYCVLAPYVPPYIIKLSSMVYVYPENRDPIDFGMGPPRAKFGPAAAECRDNVFLSEEIPHFPQWRIQRPPGRWPLSVK